MQTVETTIEELRKMVPAETRKELDKADFEEKLSLIDKAIDQGEHIWELVGDAANSEREDDDMKRWNIVDLAQRVVKRYGDNQIGEFAKRANIAQRSAEDARQMGKTYADRPRRANFLKANPTLTYSHLRTAVRGGDTETAYRILERSSKHGMTVDQLGRFITRWKIINNLPVRKRVPKPDIEPIVDFEIMWYGAATELSQQFQDHPTVRQIGKVRVIVYPANCKVSESGQGG